MSDQPEPARHFWVKMRGSDRPEPMLFKDGIYYPCTMDGPAVTADIEEVGPEIRREDAGAGKLLQAMAADVEAMHSPAFQKEDRFGPFDSYARAADYESVTVEWPDLKWHLDEYRKFLEKDQP